MAIKDMIAPGVGFSPGSVEFIVTRGLASLSLVPIDAKMTTLTIDVLKALGFDTTNKTLDLASSQRDIDYEG